ncbi:MAG: PorP/SprF family type IX secretion system membrane protein [Bacteroidota bacterium]
MDFKKNIFALCSLFYGICGNLAAQNDIAYDHLMSAATYYNPSFAGASGKTSFSHNFNNNNFNSKKPGFTSLLFSFDTYTRFLRGGVGILGYYNQLSPQTASSAYAGVIYAPKISLENNLNISPSVKFGYVYNKNKMIVHPDSADSDTLTNNGNAKDFSAGLLINTERFYAGISVDHLLEPSVNCFDSSSNRIPRKYLAQFGYHYSWDRNRSSIWHLNLIIQYQKNNSYVFLNDYFVSKKFRYRLGGMEYFYRLLFGAGYKFILYPYKEHIVYLGLGVQDHAVTLGGGFEFTAESYLPRTFEVSVKYILE